MKEAAFLGVYGVSTASGGCALPSLVRRAQSRILGIGLICAGCVIAGRVESAQATVEAGPLCRALTTSPPSVVKITPNTSGECHFGDEGPTFECRSDQAFHVEVQWETPPTERAYVVQCTLANPESVPEGSALRYIHCLPQLPSSCLAGPWNVEALDKHGASVDVLPGQVDCDYQQTGRSRPMSESTVVVVDSKPYTISNFAYCEGLAYPPGYGPGIPWAAGRCCRDFYDVFYSVDPVPGAKTIRFDIISPLPQVGWGDWRFVTPRCGDGVRSCGEQCDDGGTEALDGCDSECRREPCGKPKSVTGENPTAADALLVLRAAVGIVECDVCVCDVNHGGTVGASDALMVLRRAVGTPQDLSCGSCARQFNAKQDWDPYIVDGQYSICKGCGFATDVVSERCSGWEPEPVLGCCNCADSILTVDSPYQCAGSPE